MVTRTVGGTMVSKILGLSRWGGAISAYMELRGEEDTTPRNTAMSRGLALEESVLAMWAERAGGEMAPGERARLPQEHPMAYAHATVDGFGRTAPSGRWSLLDAKTLSREEAGSDWGEDGTDRIPVEYHLQLLWYMGVCKAAGMLVADEALLPTLTGPEVELQWAARMVRATGRPLAMADLDGTGLELRVYRVTWDADLFEEVNRRVLTFLREHVEPGIPPDPGPGDVPERDVRAVAHGLRAEPGKVLDFERMAPGEQAALLALLEANRQRKETADAEKQAAVRAKLAIGTAEEVRGLPGGVRVTWRASDPGSIRRFVVSEPRGRK